MTKIVMLGSRRFTPYEFTFAPLLLSDITDEEERFQISSKKCYPAINESDVIIVYAPDGIGEHTQRDIDYARGRGKEIFQLVPLEHEQRKMLFVTDGTEYSDMLIDRLKSIKGIELVIRDGAEAGVPTLQTDKGRFQGKGILFYIKIFCKGKEQ